MPQPNSPYLSVTTVLAQLKLGRYSNSNIPGGVLEGAGERGTVLHQLFASRLTEGKSVIPIPVSVAGYYRAFLRSIDELGIGKPLYAEYQMESARLQMNGTLDFFGPVEEQTAPEVEDPRTVLTFIDFKTGSPSGRLPDGTKYDVHPSVGLQVAGYRELLLEQFYLHAPLDEMIGGVSGVIMNAPRYALYLLNDGTYRWVPLDDPSDRANMLACVRVANLQRRLTRIEVPA